MPAVDIAVPVIETAIVLQKSITDTVAVQIAAGSGRYIVIDLEIINAIVFDEPFHRIRAVSAHIRVSEIEQVTLVVDPPLPVTADKPVVREFLRQLTLDPHDLNFEPDSHLHALAVGIIADRFHTVRKTLRRFLPFADAVPPVSFVVPAAVHTVIFTSERSRFINDRFLAFFRRIAHEAVHVVVKYNTALFIIRVRSADPAAVLRKFRQSF